MLRRYFVMDTTQAQVEDVQTALLLCIGETSTQRYSLDGSKLLIKTTQDSIDLLLDEWDGLYTWEQIKELTFSVEYTLEEIKTELEGIDWYIEIE